MMKLTDAASYFNDVQFKDAYLNTTLFKGKVMAYDDATRDSLSSERRILSVAPTVGIPARRAVKTNGTVFLVGDVAYDYHRGAPLRAKYVLHQVSELVRMYTFADAIANVHTKELYGTRLWTKGIREIDESSATYDAYTCYFAKGEDIAVPGWQSGNYMDGREKHVLLLIEGHWHIVRTTYSTAGGFMAAIADELPEPVVVDVAFTNRTYNPAPDTWTETTATKKGICIRWQSNFEYLTRASKSYVEGDLQLKMLKSEVTAVAGDTCVIKGHKYKAISVVDEAPVWAIHLRRD